MIQNFRNFRKKSNFYLLKCNEIKNRIEDLEFSNCKFFVYRGLHIRVPYLAIGWLTASHLPHRCLWQILETRYFGDKLQTMWQYLDVIIIVVALAASIQEIVLQKTWAEWQRYVDWCDGLRMLVTGLLFWWLFGLRKRKISNMGWKSKTLTTSDSVYYK